MLGVSWEPLLLKGNVFFDEFPQKDLLAILISQSDIRESSIEASVYKAVQENDHTMKAIQE